MSGATEAMKAAEPLSDLSDLSDQNPWHEIANVSQIYEAPHINVWHFWRSVMIDFWDFVAYKSKKRHLNIAIIGNTFTGKTTFLDHILPPLRYKLGLGSLEFINISCSSNMTVVGLYKKILDQLNWAYPRKSRVPEELESYLVAACRKQGLKYLIIDEFSQLHSNRPTEKASLILKALRNIPQQTKLKIGIVGTWKVLDLLKRDAETLNRYPPTYFPLLSLDTAGLTQLRQILATLDKDVKAKTKIVANFHKNSEAILKIYEYGFGRLGAVIHLYERSVTEALRSNGASNGPNGKTLRITHLDRAYEEMRLKNTLTDDELKRIKSTVETNLDIFVASHKSNNN